MRKCYCKHMLNQTQDANISKGFASVKTQLKRTAAAGAHVCRLSSDERRGFRYSRSRAAALGSSSLSITCINKSVLRFRDGDFCLAYSYKQPHILMSLQLASVHHKPLCTTDRKGLLTSVRVRLSVCRHRGDFLSSWHKLITSVGRFTSATISARPHVLGNCGHFILSNN